MLESFILRWGYLAVAVGTFFEGETVLLTAGAAAQRGLLALPWVMLVAFVGCVAGDQLWFQLGRRFGRRFVERRKGWNESSARVRAFLARWDWWFVLGFRFVYGIRIATPVFLAVNGYPPRRFALLNAIGGALWALVVGGLGWALGASLERLLDRTARVGELLALALAVVATLAIVRRWLRRRACPYGRPPPDGG